MQMITRATFMIIVAFFMLASLSNAEEGTSVITPPTDSTQGKVMPVVNQKFVQNIKEAVDMKNVTEIFNQAPDIVSYDEKGRIEYVTLKDGAKVKYSYGYNEDGTLSSVRLTSDDLVLEFRVAENINSEPDDSSALPQYSPSDDKGKEPADKPVIIYVPGEALSQIARSPIDFDKIKDGFDKALKEKNKAYEEYMKNTAPYYEKMLNELAASADGLKAEGVKVDLNAKKNNRDGLMDAGERKNVDEAVQEIRRRAQETRGEARQAERFIAVEGILADQILHPNRLIFEDKVKQAVDYVNKIIDSVIKSKLAVYLNVKKDKIEAIVNLPEAKK